MKICPENPYLIKIGKIIGHFTCRHSTCYCWSAVFERNGIRLSEDINNTRTRQCYVHCLFCYLLERVRGLWSNTVRSNTFCRSYLALGYSETEVSSRLLRHKWETIDPSVWLSVLTIHIRSSCHQNRHYFSLVHPRWIHSSDIIAYVSYAGLLFSLFFLTVDSILFWTFTFFNVLDHRTHTIRIVTSKRRKRECDIIILFGRQISFCLCRSLRARKCGS